MYFFNLYDGNNPNNFNGFNCNIVPNNWADYNYVYRQDFNRYTKCIISSYRKNRDYYINKNNLLTNTAKLNDGCYVKAEAMYMLFKDSQTQANSSMTLLMDALIIATPNQPETFDSKTYYDYISDYNKMADIGKKLGLMFTTGCSVIGIENNVGVDTSIVGSNLTQQCTGVYMRQIDNGSEFIGKITNSNDDIVRPIMG